MLRERGRIQGLYGITDADLLPGKRLLEAVEEALGAGLRLLQYRDKGIDGKRRYREAAALQERCAAHDALLVINDDPLLAKQVGAAAIHVGEEDPAIPELRAFLGPSVLIGVSCYNDLERAAAQARLGADYLAFGAVFPSATKPLARRAPLSLFAEAKPLGLPLVAIGGIDAGNAAQLRAAGCDAIAVVAALFGAPDVAQATRALQQSFLGES